MISILPQPAPYKQLHIYYFKGLVPETEIVDSPEFIGSWEEDGESFVFFHRPADEWITRRSRDRSGPELADYFQMTYEQWQGAPVTPYKVGRLQIIPAWYTIMGESAEPIIRLDPGVVFGTGTHPTTRHCLQALQQVFESYPIKRVFDLGTGTGLLAIACAILGADRVVAVDLNHLAARTAQHNVVRNAQDDHIMVVRGNAKNFMDLSCDLMVSNIHYDVMRQLIETPGFRRQKHFVLSGLLRSQARDIESRLNMLSAELVAKWEQDAVWFTLYGRNVQ